MGETGSVTRTTPGPVRHIRNKRCSCATFLDKECVYFCHLDIIWVNTPERVVSYGLGNASRRKRSIKDPEVSKQDPRCTCVRKDDNTCTDFCQMENQLRNPVTGALDTAVLRPAEGDGCAEGSQCKHTSGIKRVKHKVHKAKVSSALRATVKARLLLEKWMARQGRRAREER
ncbi:hypothetical protein DPEC_G00284540 [Dallia pectoralis]|uniref:Uncharacterized protein n=1 Tax=Dallia pectoralis TaxID=75939 RepID=A0ACC2FJL0_DALPE|nr:hypothetical protein DPEC_G00284540 [Dallia pectoralis]